MLASPLLAIAAAITHGFEYFLAYAIFIAISRMLLALVLFVFSRRIYLSYPVFLYANQVILAIVKIHMLTRLAKQKWANRGDQKQGVKGTGALSLFRTGMASYALCLYLSILLICVLQGGGFVDSPSSLSFSIFFHRLSD
jgi:glycosyltransferase Alg8